MYFDESMPQMLLTQVPAIQYVARFSSAGAAKAADVKVRIVLKCMLGVILKRT